MEAFGQLWPTVGRGTEKLPILKFRIVKNEQLLRVYNVEKLF